MSVTEYEHKQNQIQQSKLKLTSYHNGINSALVVQSIMGEGGGAMIWYDSMMNFMYGL